MKHSDGYNRKCTTPGTLSENWGTSSKGKVGKVESRQGWKWARKIWAKNCVSLLDYVGSFFLVSFHAPFPPFLGSRTKCDLGNPKNRLSLTASQLHALGANKMWTLGAKKLSLSDYKTFLCFFSLPFIFLIFFGSFIILVSSILSFLLLLGSLIYALWEPKKGVNLGSQTTVILPPLFFHSSPLLDIGS